MKLSYISSYRFVGGDASWQIVYEWEDILSRDLSLQIRGESALTKKIYAAIARFGLLSLYNTLLPKKKLKLRFLSIDNVKPNALLNKNCIPVIIDFWLNKKDFQLFFDNIKYVPLLLVTNREVYDALKLSNCPVPVEHFPLSFPDQYKIQKTSSFDKKYEFCMFGRPNPFFIRLLDKYCINHPDFCYIINNGDINNRQYISNNGDVVAVDTGRQSYIEMIRNTKISCYSTPGIDESKKVSSEYNQVTPRVFEMLCNGCQVIGHYPMAADTIWYNLNAVVPNVDDYAEFEKVLNFYRSTPADIKKYSEFMSNHYTSKRSELLKQILKKYSINI